MPAGMAPSEKWLEIIRILSLFSHSKTRAQEGYRAFLAAGWDQPSPWEQLKNQVNLGTEAFAESAQEKVGAHRNLSEVPTIQRRPVPGPLVHYANSYFSRNEAIAAAYRRVAAIVWRL